MTLTVNYMPLYENGPFADGFEQYDFRPADEITLKKSVKPLSSHIDLYHYSDAVSVETMKLPGICSMHTQFSAFSYAELEKKTEFYKSMDRLICFNQAQASFLNAYGLSNTIVIPYGIDKDRFTATKTISDKLRIGFLRRNRETAQYGESYFTDLCKRLDKKFCSFVLAGPETHALAIRLNDMGHEVRFFERLPFKLLPKFYQEIDYLYAQGGNGEGYSLPEAICSGTGVIGFTHETCFNDRSVVNFKLSGNLEQDAAGMQELKTESGSVAKDLPAVLSKEEAAERLVALYRQVAHGQE